MKQNDKNKFETKIKLNQALENNYISKNNLEFILKHIFKSNHYLIKHYKEMITKENINDMYTEINELLSYDDFFINDKILILWIARKLDNMLKDYEWILNGYLKVKDEKLKDTWNRSVYDIQRYYRTIIKCDDDCFKEYLPMRTSYNYYSYSGYYSFLCYKEFNLTFQRRGWLLRWFRKRKAGEARKA